MRRLVTDTDLAELLGRLRTLAADTPRQWGRMSCGQMVCHLSDSFRGVLGDRPPSASRATLLSRTLMKWGALGTPVPWPRGVPTSPEIDQAAGGGTPPAQFESDVATLVELMTRFTAQTHQDHPPHPGFGRLREQEWTRWAWAHVDHHLRQFGT